MSYSIGDVEKLLDIKPHVIRYWEKEIPLIQPVKDNYGRREYTERDLEIFIRLKYLLYERRFTLEGARDQLFKELSGEEQDLRGRIGALRSELLDLFFSTRKILTLPNEAQSDEARSDDDDNEENVD